MRKGSGTKVRISITIDKELASKINQICEKKTMKVSNYIEKILKEGTKDE